jgi:hypothetical protein
MEAVNAAVTAALAGGAAPAAGGPTDELAVPLARNYLWCAAAGTTGYLQFFSLSQYRTEDNIF